MSSCAVREDAGRRARADGPRDLRRFQDPVRPFSGANPRAGRRSRRRRVCRRTRAPAGRPTCAAARRVDRRGSGRATGVPVAARVAVEDVSWAPSRVREVGIDVLGPSSEVYASRAARASVARRGRNRARRSSNARALGGEPRGERVSAQLSRLQVTNERLASLQSPTRLSRADDRDVRPGISTTVSTPARRGGLRYTKEVTRAPERGGRATTATEAGRSARRSPAKGPTPAILLGPSMRGTCLPM